MCIIIYTATTASILSATKGNESSYTHYDTILFLPLSTQDMWSLEDQILDSGKLYPSLSKIYEFLLAMELESASPAVTFAILFYHLFLLRG